MFQFRVREKLICLNSTRASQPNTHSTILVARLRTSKATILTNIYLFRLYCYNSNNPKKYLTKTSCDIQKEQAWIGTSRMKVCTESYLAVSLHFTYPLLPIKAYE